MEVVHSIESGSFKVKVSQESSSSMIVIVVNDKTGSHGKVCLTFENAEEWGAMRELVNSFWINQDPREGTAFAPSGSIPQGASRRV